MQCAERMPNPRPDPSRLRPGGAARIVLARYARAQRARVVRTFGPVPYGDTERRLRRAGLDERTVIPIMLDEIARLRGKLAEHHLAGCSIVHVAGAACDCGAVGYLEQLADLKRRVAWTRGVGAAAGE